MIETGQPCPLCAVRPDVACRHRPADESWRNVEVKSPTMLAAERKAEQSIEEAIRSANETGAYKPARGDGAGHNFKSRRRRNRNPESRGLIDVTELRDEVSKYLARTGMAPTRFGRLSVGEPKFVQNLSIQSRVTTRTVAKCREFMRENPEGEISTDEPVAEVEAAPEPVTAPRKTQASATKRKGRKRKTRAKPKPRSRVTRGAIPMDAERCRFEMIDGERALIPGCMGAAAFGEKGCTCDPVADSNADLVERVEECESRSKQAIGAACDARNDILALKRVVTGLEARIEQQDALIASLRGISHDEPR